MLIGCTVTPPENKQSRAVVTVFAPYQVEQLHQHLASLSADNMAGRRFASPESIKAQEYLIASLTQSDVKPWQQQFIHPFTHSTFFTKKLGKNIIGYVQGTSLPDRYILLSAHYDHLGKKGTKIYNGADDNASGTAALLVFAEKIAKAPLKHSVIFLFTDAEEVNLLGAKAFINEQQQLLPQIKLNINIDMIAGSKKTKHLYYIDNRLGQVLSPNKVLQLNRLPHSQNIKLKRGFKNKNISTNNRISWTRASDHGAFNRAKIPFIYFGVGTHKNYHTTHDDFANVNLGFYLQACQSIFAHLRFFDDHIGINTNKT